MTVWDFLDKGFNTTIFVVLYLVTLAVVTGVVNNFAKKPGDE